MGVLLNDAANEYLRTSSNPLGTGSIYPFSVSSFYNTDADTTLQTIFSISDVATGIDYIYLARSGPADNVRVRITSTEDGAKDAFSGSDTGVGVWNQAGCVCASSVSAYAYLNGVPGAIDATDVTMGNLQNPTIGATVINVGPAVFFSGTLAEIGVWDVTLTTIEMAMLAAGYSPLFIRPASLVQYWPLKAGWGTDASGDFMDLIQGEMFDVNTGGADSFHPRIINPSSSKLVYEGGIDVMGAAAYRRPIYRGVGTGVYK